MTSDTAIAAHGRFCTAAAQRAHAGLTPEISADAAFSAAAARRRF